MTAHSAVLARGPPTKFGKAHADWSGPCPRQRHITPSARPRSLRTACLRTAMSRTNPVKVPIDVDLAARQAAAKRTAVWLGAIVSLVFVGSIVRAFLLA